VRTRGTVKVRGDGPTLTRSTTAPLLLAGNTIPIPVHFGIRTTLDEVGGFGARVHLRAAGAAIALEGSRRTARSGRSVGGRKRGRNLRRDVLLRRDGLLRLVITEPGEAGDQREHDQFSHGDAVSFPPPGFRIEPGRESTPTFQDSIEHATPRVSFAAARIKPPITTTCPVCHPERGRSPWRDLLLTRGLVESRGSSLRSWRAETRPTALPDLFATRSSSADCSLNALRPTQNTQVRGNHRGKLGKLPEDPGAHRKLRLKLAKIESIVMRLEKAFYRL